MNNPSVYGEPPLPTCDYCGRTVRDFNPNCNSEGMKHSFHRPPFKIVPDPFYNELNVSGGATQDDNE